MNLYVKDAVQKDFLINLKGIYYMNTWILVIIIYYSDAPAIESIEFFTQEKCETAKVEIQKQPKPGRIIKLVNVTCVKK